MTHLARKWTARRVRRSTGIHCIEPRRASRDRRQRTRSREWKVAMLSDGGVRSIAALVPVCPDWRDERSCGAHHCSIITTSRSRCAWLHAGSTGSLETRWMMEGETGGEGRSWRRCEINARHTLPGLVLPDFLRATLDREVGSLP